MAWKRGRRLRYMLSVPIGASVAVAVIAALGGATAAPARSASANPPQPILTLPPAVAGDPWATQIREPAVAVGPSVRVPLIARDIITTAKARRKRSSPGGTPKGTVTVAGRDRAPFRRRAAASTPQPYKGVNFEGWFKANLDGDPPDTHGGVGTQYFLEFTNHHVAIYDKFSVTSGKTLRTPATLNQFFNYSERGLTDPKAIKDPITLRWFATAITLASAGLPQKFVFAVSKTQDAYGDWWRYPAQSLSFVDSAHVADQPTIGVDQNAVFVTYNIATGDLTRVESSAVLSFPKAQVTAGNGTPLPVIQSLPPGLSPPISRVAYPETFFVAPVPRVRDADSPATTLRLYSGHNLDQPRPSGDISFRGDVIVPSYYVPYDAEQCTRHDVNPLVDIYAVLDASDTRFPSQGTQVGNRLWQVHSIGTAADPYPRIRFYRIDGTTATAASGETAASETSDDFNPSLAVDNDSYMFLTWSSTEGRYPNCRLVDIRYAGQDPTVDPPSSIGPSSVLLKSNTPYQTTAQAGVERWGDYSAVSIDPSVSPPPSCHRAFFVNEFAKRLDAWGSQIGAAGYNCP